MNKWLTNQKLLTFFDKYQTMLQGLVAVSVILAALISAASWLLSDPDPAPTQPMITMTLEQYEDLVAAKIAAAILERSSADSETRVLLNQRIETLQDRLANSDEAFETQKQTILSLQEALNSAAPLLEADAVANAEVALVTGDTTLAEALFEDIKAQAEASVLASARASFALGEIAEQDVRWQEAFSHYSDAARLDPSYAHLISAQKFALRIANYPEAESLGNAALETADKEFGKDSPQYGTALNNMATVMLTIGRYEAAEPLARLALENARDFLGEDHQTYGIRLNNLAEVLKATGRYEEAEPHYRQALEIARVALGENHQNYGKHLNNLANLLRVTGRYEDAEPLYRQALGKARAALGPTHPEVGTRLNDLALLLKKNRPLRGS